MLIANTGCKQCPDTTWCWIPPHSATQNDILNILGRNETQSLGGAAEEHIHMDYYGLNPTHPLPVQGTQPHNIMSNIGCIFLDCHVGPCLLGPPPPDIFSPDILVLVCEVVAPILPPRAPLFFATDRIPNTSATPLPRGERREKEEFGGMN